MDSLDRFSSAAGKRHVALREPYFTLEDAAEALERAAVLDEEAAYYADPELGSDPEHAASLRWDAREERAFAAKIQAGGAS